MQAVFETPKWLIDLNWNDRDKVKYFCPKRFIYKGQYNRVKPELHPGLALLAII